MRSLSDKGALTVAELLVVTIAGATLSLVLASVGGLIWEQRIDWRHAVEDASEQAMRLVDASAAHAEARAECASPVPRYGEEPITLFSSCFIVTREAGVFRPPSLGTDMDKPERGWVNSVCVQTSGTATIAAVKDTPRRLECWWHEPGCPALRIVEVPSTGEPDRLVAQYEAELDSVVPQANGCSTWTCVTQPAPKPCPRVTGATGGQNAVIEDVEWLCGGSQCFPAVPDVDFIPTNSIRMRLTAGCSAQADLGQCRDLATRETAADGLRPGEHLVRTAALFLGQAANAVSDDADFIEPPPVIQFGVDAKDDSANVADTCETDIWHFLHQFDHEAPSGVEYELEYLNADGTQASPSTVSTPSTPISATYTFTINNHGGEPPADHWTSATPNGTSLRLAHGEYILQARYRMEVDLDNNGIPKRGTGTYGEWSAADLFPFTCPNTWRTGGKLNS